MKKKTMLLACAAAVALSGCAMTSSPVSGLIYTDVQYGTSATSNEGSSKVGEASAKSILGIIATGDASIDAAAKNGGITKIHHVDVKASSVLGIFATYTVVVYGE
jgi:hypothetical protein